MSEEFHSVKASTFADPADVRAFKRCKVRGGTDEECFKVGDNGVGVWGDDCSAGSGPAVALPPDDMQAQWGNWRLARNKVIFIRYKLYGAYARVRDRMPWRSHITNGCGIDLNPDITVLLHMPGPGTYPVSWRWAEPGEGDDQVDSVS